MRVISALLLPLALSLSVLAQSVDEDDVPRSCRPICQDMITRSSTCRRINNNNGDDDGDDTDDDDDRQYISCMCDNNAWQAQTLLPNCDACVRQIGRGDGDYDDVRDLMRACGFPTQDTYSTPGAAPSSTPAPTTTQAAPNTSSAAPSPTVTGQDQNNSGNNNDNNASRSGTSEASPPGPTGTNVASSGKLANGLGAAGVALLAGAAFL